MMVPINFNGFDMMKNAQGHGEQKISNDQQPKTSESIFTFSE